MSTTTLTDSEKRERLKELMTTSTRPCWSLAPTRVGCCRDRWLLCITRTTRGGLFSTVWFPNGKDDPSLCVLIVEPNEAAYWTGSGLEGVTYLFEMARAYLTGTKAGSDDDERHVAGVKL